MISEALNREIIKQLRGRGKKVSTLVFEHILAIRDDLFDLDDTNFVTDETFSVSLLMEIVQLFLEELLTDFDNNQKQEP